jgi:hypothetical protein
MTDWQTDNDDNLFQAPAFHESMLSSPGAFISPRGTQRWLNVCLSLQNLSVIVGIGLAIGISIESIMGTGPVLAVLGAVTAFLSAIKGNKLGVAIGVSAPLFSLLVFCLIYYRSWSPDFARIPVLAMATGYLLVIGGFSLAIFLNRSQENWRG